MTSMIERIARALFQRFKDRAAVRLPEPKPGDYALDEWNNLPMSFKRDFLDDAQAALEAIVLGLEEGDDMERCFAAPIIKAAIAER